jgi:hypothetical protein
LIHKNADYIPVFVTDILPLAIYIVWTEDDIVQTEQPPGRGQVHFNRVLRNSVRILRLRDHVLCHGNLPGTVNRNAGGEYETAAAVANGGVNQIHASNEIVGVIETPNKMTGPSAA